MGYTDEKQFAHEVNEWKANEGAQSLDFIVTEDCNMRCKYCYICHKQSNKVMTFDVAKKFIDYMFSDELEFPPAIILGFIGGEPMIEVNLIDQIVDYFKFKAYIEKSEWYWNYRISITTNGVNYASPDVQKFIAKNREKLSLTITLDGTKEKHDMQRVFPDGSGTYEVIVKNIPQYINDFYPTTKVTFAHADLPLLKESIIHLWKLGIKDISANVVFENVWLENDDLIFEEQLKSLADYMIEKECYRDCSVTFFESGLGNPLGEEGKQQTICGAGLMLAIGPTGKIYPCLRYKDYSLENKKEIVIGNVDNGIDFDKVIRFRVATNLLQCDDECLNCPVATGCSHCQAQSYDTADTSTNFQRAKYICTMHKARVRANNYFYNRLYNEKAIDELIVNTSQKMYFILADDYTTYCECTNGKLTESVKVMNTNTIKRGLEYCAYNFYSPIFIHSSTNPDFSLFKGFNSSRIQHIISAQFYDEVKDFKDYILVFNKDNIDIPITNQEKCIINVEWSDVNNLSIYIIKLLNKFDRVNLNLINSSHNDNLVRYREELNKISQYLLDVWTKSGNQKEFNKITDVLFIDSQDSCSAGEKTFALSPDGKIYTCPIAYSKNEEAVGNINSYVKPTVKNQQLYSLKYSPLCKECPSTHCVRCAITNKQNTDELNIPPQHKCVSVLAEYKESEIFRDHLTEFAQGEFMPYRDLTPFPYETPYDYYSKKRHERLGFKMKGRNKYGTVQSNYQI
ncbi:MAG: radical SAM peptide maturase, CXXX-repeat target family [Paenibacillaceae bacterium]|nr:radical SAM peptide maturase, CXXX-repeat target family [Paenibacillaceae bacterium]